MIKGQSITIPTYREEYDMIKKNNNGKGLNISMIGCIGCGKIPKKDKDFKKCAKCKCVRYCSRDCQQKHWKTHKPSCRMTNRDCIDKDPKESIKRETYAIWRHSNGSAITNDPDKQTALNFIKGQYIFVSEPSKNISMAHPEVECYHLHTIDEEEFIKEVRGSILAINRSDDELNDLIELHKEHIKNDENVYISNNGISVCRDKPSV